MSVSLNHTIVLAHDRHGSAQFLVDILGLEQPSTFGPFVVVQLGNGVSLDYADDDGPPHPQHYAFLVSEAEFDEIHERITTRGLTYWADPFHQREGEINTNDGGRGLYWEDPDGHNLEIITVPYGGG
jgi:catechol 2,3-dioxygenase-like lactoylglutathione lyase family enzyme